jgi:hypothetical protein
MLEERSDEASQGGANSWSFFLNLDSLIILSVVILRRAQPAVRISLTMN